MQVHETIIPIVFFMSIVALWGAVVLTRHRERMTMIEKGLKAEDIKQLYARATWRLNPLSSLKWGMIFVGVGLAVLIGMYLHQSYDMEEGVYPGLIALLGGLGLILFYAVAQRKVKE